MKTVQRPRVFFMQKQELSYVEDEGISLFPLNFDQTDESTESESKDPNFRFIYVKH